MTDRFPLDDPESLEHQIERQAFLLHSSETPAERRAAWEQLKELHERRSPERISEMERNQGIRR